MKDNELRKTERVPLGTHRLKLQLSDYDLKAFEKRGLKTRWCNDDGGRINQALAGSYRFVTPEEATSLGESAICSGNKDLGPRVRQVVSKGDKVMYAYLMCIPKDLWLSDQQVKWDDIADKEQGLIRGHAGGAEVDSTYIPDGHGSKFPVRGL